MKITHIFAQNFCKFYGKNTLDTNFSTKTVLSGQNEVGKSTVKRIILDVLNCHDENDREITGIRPHDENGVEIDDVDIVRAVTFEIDGKEKTLKKVTRQKRNKKGEITGSVTDYSINDVPYKMADYNQYINDIYGQRNMQAVLDPDLEQQALNTWSILTLQAEGSDGNDYLVQAVPTGVVQQ